MKDRTMKKNLVLLALIGFAMFTLCGCGKEKLTVTGQDGQEFESYQECCAAEDFQAAHQFLAKMENSDDWQGDLGEAKEYVFKREALYLMSIGDAAAQKRIIYLLKEEGEDNELVSQLIDLAIDDDDEDFVKKLANQYTSEVENESLKRLSEYLFSKSEENTESLKSLYKKLNKENLLFDLAVQENNTEFIDEYISSNLSLSNTSLLEFAASRNEKKYSEMIMGLLTKEEGEIDKKPQMGVVRKHYYEDDENFECECKNFSYSVKRFNEKCQNVLGIAISNKNQYLAQRVVSKFKSNINYEKSVDAKDSHYWIFKVTADNNDINEAKATYNEAVRSGTFR